MPTIHSVLTRAVDHPSVLVVDDDPLIRSLVAIMLEDAGFEAATAESGQVALDRIASLPVQLVILDLAMPVMDGREFYRALRARGDTTPVLIVSGSGASRARQELGAEGSLSKPFDPEDLVERVRALLVA